MKTRQKHELCNTTNKHKAQNTLCTKQSVNITLESCWGGYWLGTCWV